MKKFGMFLLMVMFMASCATTKSVVCKKPVPTTQELVAVKRVDELKAAWDKLKPLVLNDLMRQTRRFTTLTVTDVMVSKDGMMGVIVLAAHVAAGNTPESKMIYGATLYLIFHRPSDGWVLANIVVRAEDPNKPSPTKEKNK